MLLTLVVFFVVAVSTPRLVFSSSPDDGDIAETPESPEVLTLPQLFSIYQSDPALYHYDGIVERSSDGGEHVWRGCPVNLPKLKKLLLDNYLEKINTSDIKEVIKSFEVCRDNGMLQEWHNIMICDWIYTVLNTSLECISGELDYVDINPSEKVVLKNIMEQLSSVNEEDSLRRVSEHSLRSISCLDHSPENYHTPGDIMIITGILSNKQCLLAIMISLFKKSKEPESFITAVLPLLDIVTRNSFLRHLETKLSYDVTRWRKCPFLECEKTDNLGKSDSSECQNTSISFRSTISEFMPMDPPKVSNKAVMPSDISMVPFFGAPLREPSTVPEAPMEPNSHFFQYKDVVAQILARVDLDTLLYSCPLVNRLFNGIATKDFVSQESQDLRVRSNLHAQMFDPNRMCIMYPWNLFFSSPRELVNYHLLANHNTTDETWLTAALGTMTEKDFALYLKDEALLKNRLKYANLNTLLNSEYFPKSDLLRLFNVILQDEVTLNGDLDFMSTEKLLHLLKHVREGAKLLKLIAEKFERSMSFVSYSMMFLDDLKMPEEVLRLAEQYVLGKHDMRISMPLDAKQIIRMDIAFLSNLISKHSLPKVIIKIFNAFADLNQLDRWDAGFWKPMAPKMIHHLLIEDPTAMSPAQFDALLAFADDAVRASCFEFMVSAVRRQSAIQKRNQT